MARLNSRVPVVIAEGGQMVRAQEYTKNISTKGCLAVVPRAFAVGQKIRMISRINQNASNAYVIWRGHPSPAGREQGISTRPRNNSAGKTLFPLPRNRFET